MSRQPAWFTMLMIALHGNEFPIDPPVKVTDHLRNRLINVVDEVMATEQKKEQIPDSVLWSLADKKWHTAPVLQRFNNLCQLKGWNPTWHVDAHQLTVGGRTYKLPTETTDQVMKKQQKKARLAAMMLLDIDDQQLDPKWLAP